MRSEKVDVIHGAGQKGCGAQQLPRYLEDLAHRFNNRTCPIRMTVARGVWTGGMTYAKLVGEDSRQAWFEGLTIRMPHSKCHGISFGVCGKPPQIIQAWEHEGLGKASDTPLSPSPT
jgi:hypothetical protein